MTNLLRVGLVARLRRLAAALADLASQVRSALAGELGRAAADAAAQVVRAAVVERPAPPPTRMTATPPTNWGDDPDDWDRDPWADEPDPDRPGR